MRNNQPKHRQSRREERKLERKRASRQGLPAVLIVCEGRETEPNYVDGLREHLRINAATVKIIRGDSTTDPVGLVRKAQKEFVSRGDFDLVYVMCDGDAPNLALARSLARQKTLRNASSNKTHVSLIVSTPSIEYWLLLHFEYSSRVFQSATEVTGALRSHLTDYQKNQRDIFLKVASGLDDACQRAERLREELSQAGLTVPYTDVDMLVQQFRRMQGS